jgi:hypothetical protein
MSSLVRAVYSDDGSTVLLISPSKMKSEMRAQTTSLHGQAPTGMYSGIDYPKHNKAHP